MFVIIGLVIVILVGLVFMIWKTSSGLETKDFSSDPVQLFVEECIENTFHGGVFELGKSGGYYGLVGTSKEGLAYYRVNSKVFVPELKTYEGELSKYIDLILPICLNEFRIFENESFSAFIKGDVESIIEIGESIISIDVDLPTEVKKGESSYSIEEYSVNVENEEIKLITRANVFGDTNYELSSLSNVGPGEFIKVEKA